MTLLNPAGLFLLLGIPVVVLLHLFRQERRRREVSSLFLWREISDQQSRRIRPQLLRNVNLLLQVLAVAAASLALAQPILTGAAGSGAPRMIVMVDTSASMAAKDGQVSRIDLAKNRARETVGRSRRDSEVLIATAGPLPAVRQGFTTDRSVLYETIRDLTVQDGAGNLQSAVEMIRGLGNATDSDIVFVTDAAFDSDPSLVFPGNFRIEQIGRPLENRAITAFTLRRRPNGSALEAYIEVANFHSRGTTVNVVLSVDSQVLSRREIELEPSEIRPLTVAMPGASGSVFQVRLDGNSDALPTDDAAFSISSSSRPVRVQLVTRGNYFLESIFSVYPNIALTVTPTPVLSQPADLYVLDEVEAPTGLTGSVLTFGSAVSQGPFEPDEFREISRTITLNRSHPIAANVDLSDVTIRRAMAGRLSGRALVVASAGELPLIYTSVGEGIRLVGVNFSLADTDLGLRSSFPVLIRNIVAWLAPSPQESGFSSVPAGTPVDLLVSPGVPLLVDYPSGRSEEYFLRENTLRFRDTVEAGVYRVRGADFTDLFAVTLTDAMESNLEPRYRMQGSEGQMEFVRAAQTGRPIWQWIAALCFLVLAADWIVWARRT